MKRTKIVSRLSALAMACMLLLGTMQPVDAAETGVEIHWLPAGVTGVSKTEGGSLIASMNNGKKLVIDENGTVTATLNLNGYSENIGYWFSEGRMLVAKDGKFGYLDERGKLVIPMKYTGGGAFSGGIAIVRDENGKCGAIDLYGNVTIPFEYDQIEQFYDGLAAAKKDGGWGYIDRQGRTVIPFEYFPFLNQESWIYTPFHFHDGMLWVKKDEKWHLFTSAGECMAVLDVDYVEDFSDGLAMVRKNGKYGFVDKKGNFVIPMELDYEQVNGFLGGVARVIENTDCGYIDKSGKLVIPVEFDIRSSMDSKDENTFDGAVILREKTHYRYGLADTSGKLLLPFEYSMMMPFSDGLTRIVTSDPYEKTKTGFADKTGRIVIQPEYDSASDFSDGVAVVYQDGKYGAINKDGTVIVPIAYDSMYYMAKGQAFLVGKDAPDGSYQKRFGVLDLTGKTLIPMEYDYVWLTEDKRVGVVENGNRYGVFQNTAYASAAPDRPTAFSDVAADDWFAGSVAWAVENQITSGTSATTFSPNATCTTAQILMFLYRSQGSPAVTADNPFSDVSESDYFYTAARWAYEKGLVSGGELKANTPCTRMSTVTYLWKLSGAPSPVGENRFSDVDDPAVTWAVEAGVTSGTGGRTFSPDTTCTRGQIVTFLRSYMNAE